MNTLSDCSSGDESSDVEMENTSSRSRSRNRDHGATFQNTEGLRRSRRQKTKVNYADSSEHNDGDDTDDRTRSTTAPEEPYQSESEASVPSSASSEDIDSEEAIIPRSQNKRKRRRSADLDEDFEPQRRKSRRIARNPKVSYDDGPDSDSSTAPIIRSSRSSRSKRGKRTSKPSSARSSGQDSPFDAVDRDVPNDGLEQCTFSSLTFAEWANALFEGSSVQYAERKSKWVEATITNITRTYSVTLLAEFAPDIAENSRRIYADESCSSPTEEEYSDWFYQLKKSSVVFYKHTRDPNQMDVDGEDGPPAERVEITAVHTEFAVRFKSRNHLEDEIVPSHDAEQRLRPVPGTGVILSKFGTLQIPTKKNTPVKRKPRPRATPKAKPRGKKATTSNRGGNRATQKKPKQFVSSDDEDGSSGYSGAEDDDKSASDSDLDSDFDRPSVSPLEYSGKRVATILYRMPIPQNVRSFRLSFAHFGHENEKAVELIEPSKTSRLLWKSLCSPAVSRSSSRRGFESDSDDESDKENSQSNASSQNMEVDEAANGDVKMEDAVDDALVDKYLVKCVNESYHHLEWMTGHELEALDQQTKLTNFNRKFDESPEFYRVRRRVDHHIAKKEFSKIHFFNGLYLAIDRISERVDPGEDFHVIAKQTSSGNQTVAITNTSEETLFLVKWRGVEYSFATYETESFLRAMPDGDEEIAVFDIRECLPEKQFLFPNKKRNSSHRVSQRPPVSSATRYENADTFKNGHQLRYYQVDGVNWLIHNWHQRISCILADEMGLGKTVQTVTFINYIFCQHKIRGPFLIVAPLSTLGHWTREFREWTDMNVVVYHGSHSSRTLIRETEFSWAQLDEKDARRAKNNWKFEVIITTKEVVTKDYQTLHVIPWHAIIIDEAHGLKSRKSLFYRKLNAYPRDHTLLLTGTPIQNNMQELFSLLHFMNPNLYRSESEFLAKYSQERLSEMKDQLQRELKKVILQRHKSLVEKDLLGRDEKIVWVELTFFQKKWYRAIYDKSYEALRNIGSQRTSLMNVSMQLRKCCNHPFLLRDAESTMSPMGTSEIDVCENLIKASGKLVLLDKLLPKLKSEGHRVLIFSQMSRVLYILEDYLEYRGYSYEKFDGSVTGTERQEAIDRYTSDDSIFAFLLTTRAGGVGINLMAADTVIIFDSDWNPMNDVQAVARAHRIGQTRKVCVYRLIVRNSYEESMFRRADKKMALNEVVMGDIADMSKSDVGDMLKMGAIAVYLKDSENNAQIEQFANASIDDILESRVETVLSKDEVSAEKAMFSQAFFAAEEEAPDIDIRDDDFWDRIGLTKKEERPDYGRGHRRRRGEQAKYKFSDASGSEFSSQDDVDEEDDEGSCLLECLAIYPWGDWERMFNVLNRAEKANLDIVETPSQSPRVQVPDDEKEKEKSTVTTATEEATEQKAETVTDGTETETFPKETKRIIYEAAVETVSAMLQLMKPTPREQMLKRLEGLLYSREFRMDVISTLARQIDKTDRDNPHSPIKKAQITRSDATETDNAGGLPNIGALSMSNVPKKCKLNCGRTVSPEVRSGERLFDTCCRHCAETPLDVKTKERPHQMSCDQRNRREFIERIERNVAHRIAGSLANDKSKKHRIRTELAKHDTEELLMRISMSRVDNKVLKQMLKQQQFGDVKQILTTIEQLSLLKMMSIELGEKKDEAYGNPNITKMCPTWWKNEFDRVLIHETCKHGWGRVDQSVAQQHGFSLHYEVTETRVKKIKLDLSRPVDRAPEDDGKDPEEIPDAPNASTVTTTTETTATTDDVSMTDVHGTDVPMTDVSATNGAESKTAPTREMETIVKRKPRKWLSSTKQIARLRSVVAHGRKLLKGRFKNYRQAIKSGKQRLLMAPKTVGVRGDVNGFDVLMQNASGRSKKKTGQSHLSTVGNGLNGGVKKKKKHKDLKIKYDAAGRIVLPLSVSKTMFIVSFGEIDPDPKFHTATKIYPIGYRCDVSNIASTCRPGKLTTFSTIIERGENGPKFVVTASDNRELRVEGSTAKSCWSKVVAMIETLDPNAKTSKKSTGSKRIGFHHPGVLNLIENLPRARECSRYVFKDSTAVSSAAAPVSVNNPADDGSVEILESPPPPPQLMKKSKSRSPLKKKKRKSPTEENVLGAAPSEPLDSHDTNEHAVVTDFPSEVRNGAPETIDLCSDSNSICADPPQELPQKKKKKKKKRRLSNGVTDEPDKKKRRTSPKKTKKQLKLGESFFARS